MFTNEDFIEAPVAISLTQSKIKIMTATEEVFQKKMDKIAKGPDGISTWLLSKVQDVLGKPICMIYNKSLFSGE